MSDQGKSEPPPGEATGPSEGTPASEGSPPTDVTPPGKGSPPPAVPKPGEGTPPPAVPKPGEGAPPPLHHEGEEVGPVADGGRNRLGAGITGVAGVLLVLATFLPWSSLGDTTVTGWSTAEGDIGDGPVFSILGVLLVVLAGLALQGVVNLATKVATIGLGVIAVIAWALVPVPAGFELDFGIYVLLLGALAAIVGGVLLKRRPA